MRGIISRNAARPEGDLEGVEAIAEVAVGRPRPSSPVAFITLENEKGHPESPWEHKFLGLMVPRSANITDRVVEAAKANRELFPEARRRGQEMVRLFRVDDWVEKVGPLVVAGLFGEQAVVSVPEFQRWEPTGRQVLAYLDETIERGIMDYVPPPEMPAPAAPAKQTRQADPGTGPVVTRVAVGRKISDGAKQRTVDWVAPSGDSVRLDGGVYVSTREEPLKVGAEGARRIVDRITRAAEEDGGFLPAAEIAPPAKTTAVIAARLSKYTPDQWGPISPAELPRELLSDRKLPKGLMLHQEHGARWMDASGRGLLADQPGLGKTITTSSVIDAPAIVVCPKSVKQNWRAELNKWRPDLSVLVLDGSAVPDKDAQSADVVIVNYESLASHADWLMKRKNQTLVADEAHILATLKIVRVMRTQKLEARGSERAQVFYDMAMRIPRLFLLSGTPFTNTPNELFALLHMINPTAWNDPVLFEKRVAKSKSLPALYEELNGTYMLRRTKDILPDFPEKVRGTVIVSLSDDVSETYEHACQDFLEWVLANGGPRAAMRSQQNAALARLNLLRALSALGKVKAATEWIENFIDSSPGKPLVVMAYHKETFAALQKAISAVNQQRAKDRRRIIRQASVTGETSEKQRNDNIAMFQAGRLDVLLFSVGMAVGVTLTRASDMLILERLWTPAKMEQAEDRIHRMGAKNTCVITYMDGAGTIDEQMAKVLQLKALLFAGAIEGRQMDESEAKAAVYGEMFKAPRGTVQRNRAEQPEGIIEYEGVLRSEFSSWDKPV
jgi:SWI/SNF-related matrix-associated actin-dependent regulator 1 of chromatin subfamily A